MGKVYQHIGTYLESTTNGVFVEIGSDRGEGSTQWLDALARDHGKTLITVDVSSKAKSRWESKLTNTEFVVQSGSQWASEFAHTCTDIDALYLDNFDYIWDINEVRPAIQLQMVEYADRGVAMTNQACQIEHLTQLIQLYPMLAPQAVVVFDDTYCYNDCWIGKCGPAVVYLLAQGWQVVHQTLDCGVILKRLDNSQQTV
jgi:hypothetical protein